MMDHPLHKKIADCLEAVLGDACQIVRDEACGGSQRIPLFVGNEKSQATEYCNVDLLVLQSGKVRGIVEIEESDIKPTQVCGKFLTSALASFYEHSNHGRLPLNRPGDVFFVQVLDSSKLKDATSKIEQFCHLERSISGLLPLRTSPIVRYRIFDIKGIDDNEGLKILAEWVEAVLHASTD